MRVTVPRVPKSESIAKIMTRIWGFDGHVNPGSGPGFKSLRV
jgi:hypothetical protein